MRYWETKQQRETEEILIPVSSKTGMELAQLPEQSSPFCCGDLHRPAVEGFSEDNIPMAGTSVYAQLVSERRAQPLHIGSSSTVGSLQNQHETQCKSALDGERVPQWRWMGIAQHGGDTVAPDSRCCDGEKQ